ncbi:MAG: MarR family transcriptional regulator [Alcaligenaceae bacterium]|nr:MarR family transcriptional regulator [Alcaligenaceae bacterium]
MMKHIKLSLNSTATTDQNIGNILRLVHKTINEQLDEGLLPLGLTGAQWRPIVLLDTGHVNTAAELADTIGVDTGAMTRTLNRLEAKGLITRQRSEKDKRVVELALTEKSLHLRTEILKAIEQILNQFFACLSKEEFELYTKLNQKLVQHNLPEAYALIFPQEVAQK